MIIKSLTLENFRQFKNKQTITFSTDSKKKSTLVIAKNHTGKTTIIESFSWILYGKTNLVSVLNSAIKDGLGSGEITTVAGSINLTHANKDYTVSRSQTFTKSGRGISSDNSVLTVTFKTVDGRSKEIRGIDAEKEINAIIPYELFSYFFFKGEQIEKIGKEINTVKSTKHREFVNAIRGMLGFNWLYQAKSDLKTLSSQYNAEIASNKTDGKLAELAKREADAESNRVKCEAEIDRLEKEIDKLTEKRESLSKTIMTFGNVEEKQKEVRLLEEKCKSLRTDINGHRKKLFSVFSEDAFSIFSEALVDKALTLLENEGNIDKGIPGLEASAVEYFLEKKECLCGHKLEEGSKEYEKLKELIKYLPPNNLGSEISKFNDRSQSVKDTARKGYDSIMTQRKTLLKLLADYDDALQKLKNLNEEIQNVDDVSKIKAEERNCVALIDNLNQQLGSIRLLLEQANNEIAAVQKERSNYTVTDNRYKKIVECKWHVDALINRIEAYCDKKESEKRVQLEDAINSIYKEIFDIGISIELDDNYNIKQTASDKINLEEFQNSTSQDAIMAFSFIGGIIKLARDKMISNTNEEDDFNDSEPYPLVMDAPSSSFDIERIEKFCQIMPKIAEQVIFFIKDTDGLYVKEYLSESIGKEYVFNQIDNYHTIIEEA
jgi:DNA sulfur modification protein DndD